MGVQKMPNLNMEEKIGGRVTLLHSRREMTQNGYRVQAARGQGQFCFVAQMVKEIDDRKEGSPRNDIKPF